MGEAFYEDEIGWAISVLRCQFSSMKLTWDWPEGGGKASSVLKDGQVPPGFQVRLPGRGDLKLEQV